MLDLPVADPWFVRERVGDGITLITEPHVHPLLRCNVWHVEGRDIDLVVDTSLGLRPLRHLVERELAGGLLAVATHAHSDHIGGLHEFPDRAIHAAEAASLDDVGRRDPRRPPCTARPCSAPTATPATTCPPLMVDAVPAGGLAAAVLPRPAAPATRLLAARRRDRPRRPGLRGAPPARPLPRQHRPVGGGDGSPVLRRCGLRRTAARRARGVRHPRLRHHHAHACGSCRSASSTPATSRASIVTA